MGFTVFEGAWKVERIDLLVGVERDIEIRTSNGIHECLVFIFWIEDDDICSHHEGPEDLEFHGE